MRPSIRYLKVEERFEFKNKRFRGMCVTVMLAAMAIAVVYAILGTVNYGYCANYPRFYCRLALTLLFAIETVLFAHRNSVYLEIGGDFALARRSGSLMILILIISALVEAYYVSAVVVDSGTMRAVYMCLIILIGCLSALPLIQYQYMDLHFFTMRLLVFVGMAASVISFVFGLFFIGVNEIEMYRADGILQTVSRVLDSLSPVYLINGLNGVVILTMAHISFKKEEKRNAKFMPENAGSDPFIENGEPVVDEAAVPEEELEYNDL